jgi:hypothetical protein
MKKLFRKVSGNPLPESSFLWVPDREDPRGWRFVVSVPNDAARTVNLLRGALACFPQAASVIPANQREKIWWQLTGAARSHGIATPTQMSAVTSDISAEHKALNMNVEAPSEDELSEAIAEADRFADAMLRRLGFDE